MLLGMYIKCGHLVDAETIFAQLAVKNVISWNALITGYAEHGPYEQVFTCFEQMQLEGITPNSVTVASVIKACGDLRAIEKGREIHLMFILSTHETDLSVANTCIGMYAKCGSLLEAQKVFDAMATRDVVTWTALMAGYAQHGPPEKALECFHQMQKCNITPNAVSFSCVLKACSSIGDLEEGQKIHAYIAKEEYETDRLVMNSLIDLYGKCGSLIDAREVFGNVPFQDAASWTSLIVGCIEHGHGQEALKIFNNMQVKNIPLDVVSYVCGLKACSLAGAVDNGLSLHAEIGREGFEGDLTINNTLISMYSKFGWLTEAEDVFDMLHKRSVCSWTALIAGYSEHGYSELVLRCFEQMQTERICPNDVTYCCFLRACGIIKELDRGGKCHQEIVEKGLEKDTSIGTTLVGMYSKCGSLSQAQGVFRMLSVQDVTAWTAMIAGYTEQNFHHEALHCFNQMQHKCACSNTVTYICVLKACGSLGVLVKITDIHKEVVLKGFESDFTLNNSLIGAYAKCGSFQDAWSLLNNFPAQDVVTWSAMIKGYAVNQESDMAIECFHRMLNEGLKPDAVLFLCLLTACGHGSMVLQGQDFFNMMGCVHNIQPAPEHLNCMVYLFARVGLLYEALTVLEMLSPASEGTWLSLLSACKIYGEQELGLRCFQQLVELNPRDATWYVIMSDIYMSDGKLDDALGVERMRLDARAEKKPAISTIELNHKTYEFLVGSGQYTESPVFSRNLWRKMQINGHIPDLDTCRIYYF
ncbi:hypothetical protein KP509_22G068500 [Ceratopteris richardii]|nr:hypothetical protein KP509_22G068500 [Ceratopteris richardii]